MMNRIRTGVIGLDDLLGGGLIPNSVSVLLGSAGVGKTLISIQFLIEGIRNGEKCIFISFDIGEHEIVKHTKAIGWKEVEDYIAEGKLAVRKFFAENVTLVNNDLLNILIDESGAKTRVVIDSFTPMISSFRMENRNDINWFLNKLREIGTSILTVEEPLDGNMADPSVTLPIFLSDTVIHLKNIGYGEAFSRALRIIKHRGSWHAEGVFPYKILDGVGVFVEGGDLVRKQREIVNLEEVLNELDIKKDELDEELLKRLEKLSESGNIGARDAIRKILSLKKE
jgi:KaiC/GvpD/RAD55 family RecA-like ATPase